MHYTTRLIFLAAMCGLTAHAQIINSNVFVREDLTSAANKAVARALIGLFEWTTNSVPAYTGNHSSEAALDVDDVLGDAGVRFKYGTNEYMLMLYGTNLNLVSALDGSTPAYVASPGEAAMLNYKSLTNLFVMKTNDYGHLTLLTADPIETISAAETRIYSKIGQKSRATLFGQTLSGSTNLSGEVVMVGPDSVATVDQIIVAADGGAETTITGQGVVSTNLTAVVADIAALEAWTNSTTTTIHVKDWKRGGRFAYSTTSLTPESALVSMRGVTTGGSGYRMVPATFTVTTAGSGYTDGAATVSIDGMTVDVTLVTSAGAISTVTYSAGSVATTLTTALTVTQGAATDGRVTATYTPLTRALTGGTGTVAGEVSIINIDDGEVVWFTLTAAGTYTVLPGSNGGGGYRTGISLADDGDETTVATVSVWTDKVRGLSYPATGIGTGSWVRDPNPGSKTYVSLGMRYIGASQTKTIPGEWFGADGDYNTSTRAGIDSTPALQAWLNALIGYNGELSGGTFCVTDALTIPEHFRSVTVDFGGAHLYLTNATPVKAVILFNEHLTSGNTFKSVTLNANVSADYCVLHQALAPDSSITSACSFEGSQFYGGNTACVRVGTYTDDSLDCDHAMVRYWKCGFSARPGAIGYYGDAPNISTIKFDQCSFWDYVGDGEANTFIKLVRGLNCSINNCFLQEVADQSQWAIWVGSAWQGCEVNDTTFEYPRLLYAEDDGGNGNNVSIRGCQSSDALSDVTVIHCGDNVMLTLDDTVLAAPAATSERRVYVADKMVANNVLLGQGGRYLMDKPYRCSIDGVVPTAPPHVNPNPFLTEWKNGSLVGNYSVSTNGVATLTAHDNTTTGTGYSYSQGIYCAKLVVATATLGTNTTQGNGLEYSMDVTANGCPQGYTLVAYGNVSAGANVVLQAQRYMAGMVNTTSGETVVVSPDGSGYWFGAAKLTGNISYMDDATRLFFTVGVDTPATLYIAGFFVMKVGNNTTFNGKYPDYPALKAYTGAPWPVFGNSTNSTFAGEMSSTELRWTGSNWTIAGGVATHSGTASDAFTYTSDCDYMQYKRAWLKWDLNDSVSTTVRVGGASLSTKTTSGTGLFRTGNQGSGSANTVSVTTAGDGVDVDNIYVYLAAPGYNDSKVLDLTRAKSDLFYVEGLIIDSATAPTVGTDQASLYSADSPAGAGTTRLYTETEDGKSGPVDIGWRSPVTVQRTSLAGATKIVDESGDAIGNFDTGWTVGASWTTNSSAVVNATGATNSLSHTTVTALVGPPRYVTMTLVSGGAWTVDATASLTVTVGGSLMRTFTNADPPSGTMTISGMVDGTTDEVVFTVYAPDATTVSGSFDNFKIEVLAAGDFLHRHTYPAAALVKATSAAAPAPYFEFSAAGTHAANGNAKDKVIALVNTTVTSAPAILATIPSTDNNGSWRLKGKVYAAYGGGASDYDNFMLELDYVDGSGTYTTSLHSTDLTGDVFAWNAAGYFLIGANADTADGDVTINTSSVEYKP